MNRRIFYLNITLLFIAVLLAVGTFSPGGLELIQKTLAAVTGITGEGTINYLSRFAGAANPSNQIGDSIIYDSGTNIGIGTTNPGVKLDVAGGQFRLTSNNIGSLKISQYTDLTRITSAGASGGGILALQREATAVHGQPAGSYSVELWSGANGGTQTLTATGGNVGIGTAAPATKLHVNGAMMLTPLASDPTGLVNGMMWMRQ